MARLAAVLICLVACPALAQSLERPMLLAPLSPVPLHGGLAPMPDRGVEWPRRALSDAPRLEPALLGTRDSASAAAFAPASPGLQEDRLTRQPAPALRLTVPFRD
jgi:hypothetical protein